MLGVLKKSAIILITLIIVAINTYVLANLEYKVNLSGQKELAKGKIVNVTLSMDIIKAQTNADAEFYCIIDYDKAVFEKLIESNIEAQDNWNVKYDEATGELVASPTNNILSSGNICVISFKVKTDTEVDTTKIVAKECALEVSDVEEPIKADNVELEFKYKDNSSIIGVPKENKNTVKDNNNVENTKDTNSNAKSANITKKEEKKSDSIQLYIAIGLLISVVIAVIVVFTIVNKKQK